MVNFTMDLQTLLCHQDLEDKVQISDIHIHTTLAMIQVNMEAQDRDTQTEDLVHPTKVYGTRHTSKAL
jgi:methyltransferase-like protein